MDTKFSVATHILILISEADKDINSRDIAESVGTNASYIRKICALLKNANIIDSHQGNNGYKLNISADKLTLLKIYQAVSEENKPHLFDIHLNPNDKCLVGTNIKPVLNDMFTDLEDEFAKELEKRTLLDCINEIRKRL